jgi:hypothetical protein
MMEAEVKILLCETVCTSHCSLGRWKKWLQAKDCRQPIQTRKGKGKDSPTEPPKGMQPCWHLHFRTSSFENNMLINLYGFGLEAWLKRWNVCFVSMRP